MFRIDGKRVPVPSYARLRFGRSRRGWKVQGTNVIRWTL